MHFFNKLWTENGVLVEFNQEKEKQELFWDRATLYALRGAIHIGENELGIQKLKAYSRKRLLGDHVPYVVEAYPENNMKHLSAESALYCRIFTEAILGIELENLNSFSIKPNIPKDWDYFKVKNLGLFDKSLDVELEREENAIRIIVKENEKVLVNSIFNGKAIRIET